MSEIRVEGYSPLFGKVSLNFINLSGLIFQKLNEIGEFERQKNNNHLGLLSHSFSTLSHSRYDYLVVQSVISELVENTFKGTTSAQGSININGKTYGGNEILKIWFMLSNIGHCKNTIGDEKALMFYSSKRRGMFSHIISPLRDEPLKKWSRKILDRYDYIKFHHILSFYRIHKIFRRNTDLQDKIISIYKILLLPSSEIDYVTDKLKIVQLKNLFRNIRNLSIISLDTVNSHIPIHIDILSTVLSFDFSVDKFQGRRLSQLFNPLINLLYDKLYLSTSAQTIQRSYELRAIQFLNQNSYSDIIELSLNSGLASPENDSLDHFVRKKYKLAPGQKVKDHFNIMLQLTEIDEAFNISIDFNSITKDVVLDIYVDRILFTSNKLGSLLNKVVELTQIIDQKQLIEDIKVHQPLTANIVNSLRKEGIEEGRIHVIIQPMIVQLATEMSDKNILINLAFFKNMAWSIIRYFVKDKYYFDLDNYNLKSSFGIIYPNKNERMINVIGNEKSKYQGIDNDRVRELEHLEYAVSRNYNGYVIACLDRIKVYDYSKAPSKRDVTDIDSLVIKFNSNEFIVEFNETKNMNNCENVAKRDLRRTFTQILDSNAVGYRVLPVNGFGAKVRIRKCT